MRKQVEIVTCDICKKETPCAQLRASTGECESDGVESRLVYVMSDVCMKCLEARLNDFFRMNFRGAFADELREILNLK